MEPPVKIWRLNIKPIGAHSILENETSLQYDTCIIYVYVEPPYDYGVE
jgi:hypothetical protein